MLLGKKGCGLKGKLHHPFKMPVLCGMESATVLGAK